MRIVTREGAFSPAVAGVRSARVRTGRLHDIMLDRDFASNRTIYFLR